MMTRDEVTNVAKSIVDGLLLMTDRGFDPIAKKMVREWSTPPTSLDILKTLDACVHSSLCAGITIELLDLLWKRTMEVEGVTEESVVKQANETWRKEYHV